MAAALQPACVLAVKLLPRGTCSAIAAWRFGPAAVASRLAQSTWLDQVAVEQQREEEEEGEEEEA
eukprot:2402067-Alexandrium_andersonii.AAC.1